MPIGVLLTWDAHRRRDVKPAQRRFSAWSKAPSRFAFNRRTTEFVIPQKSAGSRAAERTCISPSSNPDTQPSLEEDAMLAKMGWFEWSMIGVVVLGAIAAAFVVANQL